MTQIDHQTPLTISNVKARLNYLILNRLELKSTGGISNPFEKDSNWYEVTSSGPGIYSSTNNLVTTEIEEGNIVYMANHGVKPFCMKDSSEFVYAGSVLDVIASTNKVGGEMKPYGNFVVIEPIESNLQIKYSATETPEYWWGIVKKVGPGLKNESNEYVSLDLKEGQMVMFIPFRAIKLKYYQLGLEDTNEFFIDSSEIVGVLE